MDSIIAQVKTAAAQADGTARVKLNNALRNILYSTETPFMTTIRIVNEMTTIRIADNLGLFQRLIDAEQPLTAAQLAKASGAEAGLVSRVLRHLAANHLIDETGPDTFKANRLTKPLTRHGSSGFINHMHECMGDTLQAWPDFLRERGYPDTVPVTDTAFQKAFNTDATCFDWLYAKGNEHRRDWFLQAMSAERDGDWLSVFPLKNRLLEPSSPGDPPVFVDVGGATGHQSARLVSKLPELKGRVIVEDLPAVVARAPNIDGVKFVEQNFFNPNVTPGARFYYLRTVLHDWPEGEVVTILSHLRKACGSVGKIIVDDVVVPDEGASAGTMALDVLMNSCLGASERRLSVWKGIVEKAGLEIESVSIYSIADNFSIMVLAPKK